MLATMCQVVLVTRDFVAVCLLLGCLLALILAVGSGLLTVFRGAVVSGVTSI